jgi:GNAT superfamily N-acetyltransferase
MKNLVERGSTTGLLAFIGNEPAGWCSLGPREDFPVLENSKILARPDEKPVWSIVCFFIEKKFRRQGLSGQFLGQIMQYAKKSGAKILEGYPIATDNDNYPATFAYTGFYSSFIKSGFVEVARRSPTRPIMRYNL